MPENKAFDLSMLPEKVDDFYFCVLNAITEKNIDHYFNPLVFLESYSYPAVVLKIGKFVINMPLDWNIIMTDEEFSDVEVVPLTSIVKRDFKALVYNPLEYKLPTAENIEVETVYNEVKWYFPKMADGMLFIVPLENGDNPRCCAFSSTLSKIHRNLSLNHIIEYE